MGGGSGFKAKKPYTIDDLYQDLLLPSIWNINVTVALKGNMGATSGQPVITLTFPAHLVSANGTIALSSSGLNKIAENNLTGSFKAVVCPYARRCQNFPSGFLIGKEAMPFYSTGMSQITHASQQITMMNLTGSDDLEMEAPDLSTYSHVDAGLGLFLYQGNTLRSTGLLTPQTKGVSYVGSFNSSATLTQTRLINYKAQG